MSTKKKNVGRKPTRLCVCCGETWPKADMIRIVVSGRNTEISGAVKDDTGKQHGRGEYICRRVSCIKAAYDEDMIDESTRDECLNELTDTSLRLLSIIMKSGRLASGEYQCEEAIASGDAGYVIIAEDASDNTRKKFADKCSYYGVPYVICGAKEQLGQLIGKAARSVVAIKDEQFSAQFIRRFGGM